MAHKREHMQLTVHTRGMSETTQAKLFAAVTYFRGWGSERQECSQRELLSPSPNGHVPGTPVDELPLGKEQHPGARLWRSTGAEREGPHWHLPLHKSAWSSLGTAFLPEMWAQGAGWYEIR